MRSAVAAVTSGSSVESTQKADAASSVARDGAPIVTTSWDDGDPFDLQIARELADRKLSGTFYIPVKGHHSNGRIDRAEIVTIDSWGFEIGAHGISHPHLPSCDDRQLAVEVEGSKKRMEDDLGKQVTMFAYPRGRHSSRVVAAVKRAGFHGARTTAMLSCELAFDPFRMPTSVHVFPHSRVEYLRNLARAADVGRAWGYLTRFWPAADWLELAMLLFDRVLKFGGIWHLYGHSWEVNEMGLRQAMGVVLDYVSNRPGVLYLANGAVVKQETVQPAQKLVYGQESPR